ncbi:hypothetical protein [Streptomyces sp. NPDC088727]|uniref:hypothetical protein n=1 Tax=Streptomyces sp. NPDC088727 TaxID=3365875 RepID=UPI003820AADE
MTSDPFGNASTRVRGTVIDLVRVFVLCQGRDAFLEGAHGRRGRLGRRFELRRQRYDAYSFQAFALPAGQGRPHLGLPLLGQPFPDVHPVDGDAGFDVREMLSSASISRTTA